MRIMRSLTSWFIVGVGALMLTAGEIIGMRSVNLSQKGLILMASQFKEDRKSVV